MIGDRIKQLRKERRMTQGDLADRAGINRSYLSVLENSHSSPTIDVVERLAEAMGVNLWMLISELENKHFTYDTDDEYEMPEGLQHFLSDNDEMMLTQPSATEITELKKIVFHGSVKPDKRFFRDALLAIRRAKQ